GRAAADHRQRGRDHPGKRAPGAGGPAGGDRRPAGRPARPAARTPTARARRRGYAGRRGPPGRLPGVAGQRGRRPGRGAGHGRAWRVPDRAGGAHQRPQARTRAAGHRDRTRRGRRGPHHRTPQSGTGERRPDRDPGRRHRPDRAGRTGGHSRRAARTRTYRGRVPAMRLAAVAVMTDGGAWDPAGGVRILLVDDDPLVRAGLRIIIDDPPALRVVGEAADGSQVLAAVETHAPHVVLMDIRMPGLDGLSAAELLRRRPAAPEIILLTAFHADEYVLRALRAPARPFLLKDTPPAEILRAVTRVAAGEPFLSPAVLRQVLTHVGDTGADERRQHAR